MSATVEVQQRPSESWEAPAGPDHADSGPSRGGGLVLALLPAAIVGYLAFRTGGYHPDAYSSVVVLLAVGLGGVALVAKRPFAGFSAPLLVACAALLLLVAWTWLSSSWSDAPIRALTEAQRTGLYFLTLVFFGAFLRRRGSVSLAATVLGVVMAGVCAAALATRLFPDVFTVSDQLAPQRLSFPLSYWNSLGLFAGIALILLVNTASDLRVRAALRVLGAAGVPIAALTVYFTFSRGAAGALALGLVAYLVAGRSRGMVGAALSAGPATALALIAAYGADLLATHENTTAAATAQGHDVAVWLIVACIGAAVLRAALIPLDDRLAELRSPIQVSRRGLMAAGAIGVVLTGGALVALNAPGHVHAAYDSFTKPEISADARTRFREVTLSGREEHWNVALDYYRAHRLAGEGAGTFETQWLRSRPLYAEATEAHSLYIEVLSELGIVGFALLVAALGTILLGLLVHATGPRRPVYGALFAATLMWAVHAGVDRDWELPAVGLGLFALAGIGLARPAGSDDVSPRLLSSLTFRIAVALACLLVALMGARLVIADAAIDEAKAALEAGQCDKATRDARLARSVLSTHPASYEVIGYCDLAGGHRTAAVKRMRRATELDPDQWRYWYGLGVARAANGRDPRAAMRRAWMLNPLGAYVRSGAGAQLRVAPRGLWKRLAARAPWPTS